MNHNIPYQNKTLTLTMPSPDEIRSIFESRIQDMLEFKDDPQTAKFYSLEEVEANNTIADINQERQELESILNDITQGNYDKIISTLDKITKTKKGVFRKNGVAELFVIASATDYFTDYTNAWATMTLKLRAVAPTTIEMVFEQKTYTIWLEALS